MSYSHRSLSDQTDAAAIRLNGERTSVLGLGPSDHLCWSYEDPDPFASEAAAFLIEGVDLKEQVAFIGDSDTFHLIRGAFVGLGGDAEALKFWTVADTYEGGAGSVDPAVPVANYSAKVDEALEAGNTGLRIVAEATPLVIDPDHRSPFLEYEMAVEELMATRPFSAMCAYRMDLLGPEAVEELAAVHPLARAGTSQFRLFRCGDGTIGLGGEIDIASDDLFVTVLARLPVPPSTDGLVMDASNLSFIDARGLSALDEWAAKNGPLALRSPRSIIRRLAAVIEVENLTLEAIA